MFSVNPFQKPAGINSDVATTPERFALRPLRPEEELERALQEYQQTKIRLEMDSPTSGTPTSTTMGRTALNFSPIGESTKIGAPITPKAQSNVTPLLRRLMIRNAEEDRKERNHIITGRPEGKAFPDVEHTKYDRISMDLSSMWGTGDPEERGPYSTINESATMVEDTVDLTQSESPKQEKEAKSTTNEPNAKTTSIIKALRRQTMHFTHNASLDISPQAVKENVATLTKTNTDPALDDSVEIVDSSVKIPKICAAPRKSLEDSLRDDILKAKEELLGKAVVINKSDKRRSLLPSSMGNTSIVINGSEEPSALKPGGSNVNRRRTLFNVNDISEGGIKPSQGSQLGLPKQATKRRTLLPPASNNNSSVQPTPGSPLAVEVKKTKKLLNPPANPSSQGAKSKQSLSGTSQVLRKGTNMGPPTKVPPSVTVNGVKAKPCAVTKNKPQTPPKNGRATNGITSVPEEGTSKRKLFNSIAELSPVSSPSQSQPVSRISMVNKGKPAVARSLIKNPEPPAKNIEQSVKKRRSSFDFEDPSTVTLANSSTASTASSRSTVGSKVGGSSTTAQRQKNVIVLTNGHSKQLEFIKEVNFC